MPPFPVVTIHPSPADPDIGKSSIVAFVPFKVTETPWAPVSPLSPFEPGAPCAPVIPGSP